MPVQGPWFEEIDRNGFFNTVGEFSMRLRGLDGVERILSLEEWQSEGFDKNSLYGDPLFLDPERGNYQVRSESPALKVGFKNFEMGGWGLTDAFGHW